MGRPVSVGGAPRALRTQILGALVGAALGGVLANRLRRGMPMLFLMTTTVAIPSGPGAIDRIMGLNVYRLCAEVIG